MKLLVKKISYPQHPLMKHKNQVVKKNTATKCVNLDLKVLISQ